MSEEKPVPKRAIIREGFRAFHGIKDFLGFLRLWKGIAGWGNGGYGGCFANEGHRAGTTSALGNTRSLGSALLDPRPPGRG